MRLSPSRPTRRATLALLWTVAAVMLLQPLAAHADLLDGYDTWTPYNPSTQVLDSSPGPWLFSPDNTGCWASSVVALTNQWSLAPFTRPNVYEVGYNGVGVGCTNAAHSSTLALSAVAAGTVVTVTFRIAWLYQLNTADTFMGWSISMCGTPVANSGVTVGGMQASPTWLKYSYTAQVPVSAGQSCTITWTFNTPLSDATAGYAFVLDNVYVEGASALVPGYNFAMYNVFTGQFYNVTAATMPQNSTAPTTGLTVTVNTQGATPSVTVAPITPDLVLAGLAGSSTVQVCVTALYCNSFITPTSLLNPMAVYLALPAQAISCLFQIASQSGQFPAGSSITITDGNELVASGYLDGNHQFPAFLPTDGYNLAVSYGTFTYSTTVSVSATSSSFTISVPGLTGNAFVGGLGTLAYNAGWDAPLQNVVYYYTDTSVSTTLLKARLILNNASGSFSIASSSNSAGPYGTVQGQFSCHTDACNATLSAGLSVLFTATNQFGTLQPYGPVPLTSGGLLPGISQAPPPGSLGGMSEFFPGLTYPGLGAFFVLIVGGSAFGEYDAPLGAIWLALLGVVLVGLGALPWPVLVTASLVVVAILSFIEWREKRSQNPYT